MLVTTALGFGGAYWYRHSSAGATPDLNFDNRALTFPGRAAVHALAGAAWTLTPSTEVVVHVVNDGAYPVNLDGGSLSGEGFSGGSLTPDESILAPGQAGTLHGLVTLDCTVAGGNEPPRALVAAIQTSTAGGLDSTVRLELKAGSFTDLGSSLCTALPNPLDVLTHVVPANGGGVEVQVVAHNITSRPIEASVQAGIAAQPAGFRTIPPGATTVFELTTSEVCYYAPKPDIPGAEAIRQYAVSMKTVSGDYDLTANKSLDDPLVTAACHG